MKLDKQKNLGEVIQSLIKRGLTPTSSSVSLLMGKQISTVAIQAYLDHANFPHEAPIKHETSTDGWPTPYDFYTSPTPRNNLIGNLGGEVVFVQNQTITIPPQAESQKLVCGRTALLTFIPLSTLITNIEVRSQFGTLIMRQADESRFDTDQPSNTNRPKVRHSANRRMVMLPAHWMVPGLELTFWYASDLFGTLTADKLDFGPPAELVLQNIRIGMLTPPKEGHKFEEQPFLKGIDYFQKIPVAKLVVAQYEAVHFQALRMPDGELYTKASKTEGGVYDGDMRQYIGKEMVSVGINLANYGIHESPGFSEANPQHYMQIVVHTSRGNYTNGVVDHGLSGGGGMCTLWETDGNEFSHEAGHNYHLGHHVGGGQGSIQHPGPGWGFDFYRQRFIANIMWTHPAEDSVLPEFPDYRVKPFSAAFKYNFDAMAGGAPDGNISSFTHHTNYVAKRIQSFFSDKAVIDPNSPSGYMKWNDSSKKMIPHYAAWPKPVQFGVPVFTIVGYIDPNNVILPSFHVLYGNYGHVYPVPETSASSGKYYLEVVCINSTKKIPLSGIKLGQAIMNKIHFNIPYTEQPTKIIYRTGPHDEEIIFTQEVENSIRTLPPPVIIGGDHWEENAVQHIPDFTKWSPSSKNISSLDELEQQLALTYGPIHDYSATEQNNRTPGEFFRHKNPSTGKHQYFALKQRQHSELPTDKSDNECWRYLGDAEQFVPNT